MRPQSTLTRCPFVLIAAALCLVVGTLVPQRSASGAVTAEQRKQIGELESGISTAGRLYASGKFFESAEKLTEVQKSFLQLLENKDPLLQKSVRPIFNRLEKAHALLELEGAELQALPSWDKLVASDVPSPGAVSFKTDIAPWLVAQCGTCHIANRRGQFSMATFTELLQGINGRKVVNPGGGKGSRIVEVIESGDMPRSGGQVSPENLDKLQKWIDGGAKFDGPDPAAPLRSYVKSDATSAAPELTAQAPTGKETVRFSKDVAPILMESCIGCHINVRRPSGELNMDTFGSLLQGGESGNLIVIGKPDDSLLIKKLNGTAGDRMPKGRAALSSEKIALISTWIREGATYDGGSPTSNIESVVNQAWSETASHTELFARRSERATGLWKKVLPNSDPSIAKNDEFLVMGNVTLARAEEWLAAANEVLPEVRKQLKLPSGVAVKGGITLFVYKARYDYNEFGRMNEQRTLPANWQAHWRTGPLDVYVAIVDDTALDAKQQSGILVQQLTGAIVGSLPQAPSWFSEGVARNIAIATAARGDPRIAQWKRNLGLAASMVDKSETLLKGELDDEATGLIGMKLVGVMMDGRNRKRFDSLLELMRGGKPFPEALGATFASPEKFVKSWIGK